jgi:hypothetical protein
MPNLNKEIYTLECMYGKFEFSTPLQRAIFIIFNDLALEDIVQDIYTPEVKSSN